MKKRKHWLVLALLVTFFLSTAGAVSAMLIPAADEAKEKAKADNSPVIEKVTVEDENHLALTPPGLERIVFIHYKKGFAKPPWVGGGKGEKEPKCYDFLGRGVSWRDSVVDYVVDPTNSGLAEDFVTNAISAGAEEWDSWTDVELFNNSYETVYDGSWDSDAPDGRNELVFGDYPEKEVIAVTVVWGYFSGPPSTRRIVEFDVLFDVDWRWGNAETTATFDPKDSTAVMDLQNIATHEIGHGAGLGDIYESACSEVTMYGFSDYEETKKRTLDQPDITGIQELYGG